jgi:hypothetical protein
MAINPSFKEASFDADDDVFDIDDRPANAGGASSVASGWASAEAFTAPAGDYPVEFKHTEQPQVLKFIDPDGPVAVYRQHFLTAKEGKKSYVCLGNGCPLCTELGNRPEDKRAFSVVNLSTAPFQRQLLIATPRLFKTLHSLNFTPQGPLAKNYWAISRTGVKQTTMYNVNPVKGRDLEEDWGINEAEVNDFLSSVEAYDRSVVKESSFAELLEIAKSLS